MAVGGGGGVCVFVESFSVTLVLVVWGSCFPAALHVVVLVRDCFSADAQLMVWNGVRRSPFATERTSRLRATPLPTTPPTAPYVVLDDRCVDPCQRLLEGRLPQYTFVLR